MKVAWRVSNLLALALGLGSVALGLVLIVAPDSIDVRRTGGDIVAGLLYSDAGLCLLLTIGAMFRVRGLAGGAVAAVAGFCYLGAGIFTVADFMKRI